MCQMGTVTPATGTAVGASWTAQLGAGGPWGCRGCGCSRALHVPIHSVFSSSPFMNKLFPASFPSRQYQLLFTQGTGENKEGQCHPPPPAWGVSPYPTPPPFAPPTLGLHSRASNGEGGFWGLSARVHIPALPLPAQGTLGERLYLSEPWVFAMGLFFHLSNESDDLSPPV